MAGIDKAAFLKRISGPPDEGDAIPGAAPAGEMDAEESTAETDTGMTCGEQLMAAVEAKDAAGIDAALREAVAKYGK